MSAKTFTNPKPSPHGAAYCRARDVLGRVPETEAERVLFDALVESYEQYTELEEDADADDIAWCEALAAHGVPVPV